MSAAPKPTLKAVADVDELDPLEVATAAAADAQRKLDERNEKVQQIQAQRADVQARLGTTAVSGDVRALGDLSKERAMLLDAEAAIVEFAIPELTRARDVANEKANAINRERIVAQAQRENLAEVEKVRASEQTIVDAFAGVLAVFKEHTRVLGGASGPAGVLQAYGVNVSAPGRGVREIVADFNNASRNRGFGTLKVEFPIIPGLF